MLVVEVLSDGRDSRHRFIRQCTQCQLDRPETKDTVSTADVRKIRSNTDRLVPDVEANTEIENLEVLSSNHSSTNVGNLHFPTSVDTGGGLHVFGVGANPSVRATSVDNQFVCIRRSIGSRNFSLEIKLTIMVRVANGNICNVVKSYVDDRIAIYTA